MSKGKRLRQQRQCAEEKSSLYPAGALSHELKIARAQRHLQEAEHLIGGGLMKHIRPSRRKPIPRFLAHMEPGSLPLLSVGARSRSSSGTAFNASARRSTT